MGRKKKLDDSVGNSYNRITERDYFRYYKANAVSAAYDLGYGLAVVAKVKAATSSEEITRIMHDARMKQDYADEAFDILEGV